MYADQRLCFRYTDSTIPLISKSSHLPVIAKPGLCRGLVRNPEDRFSQNEAHICPNNL